VLQGAHSRRSDRGPVTETRVPLWYCARGHAGGRPRYRFPAKAVLPGRSVPVGRVGQVIQPGRLIRSPSAPPVPWPGTGVDGDLQGSSPKYRGTWIVGPLACSIQTPGSHREPGSGRKLSAGAGAHQLGVLTICKWAVPRYLGTDLRMYIDTCVFPTMVLYISWNRSRVANLMY
jgi:hypothetical protein